jgi:hypothetical protein
MSRQVWADSLNPAQNRDLRSKSEFAHQSIWLFQDSLLGSMPLSLSALQTTFEKEKTAQLG